VVVILEAREPARIMIAIGTENRWHLQLAQRWIVQYNFYINDQNWGRMFVRICPYLPFFQRAFASISTTGWLSACAPKASILSNVPMRYSDAPIHRSFKSWPASLRYDLRKLRAKALVEKLPKSRRYQLRPQGYSICLVFVKLFERVYSPLTAGLFQPYQLDSKLQDHKTNSVGSALSKNCRRSRRTS
jgi:hypothetical protein